MNLSKALVSIAVISILILSSLSVLAMPTHGVNRQTHSTHSHSHTQTETETETETTSSVQGGGGYYPTQVIATMMITRGYEDNYSLRLEGFEFLPIDSSAGTFGNMTFSSNSGASGNVLLNLSKQGSGWLCTNDTGHQMLAFHLHDCDGSAEPIYYQLFALVVPLQNGMNIITLKSLGNDSRSEYSTVNYFVFL